MSTLHPTTTTTTTTTATPLQSVSQTQSAHVVTSKGVEGLATAEATGWHHEIQSTTTTSTTIPHLSAPNPVLLSEDVTKNYLPTHDTSSLSMLINKLNSMSVEIDMYAKAQQDLVSKEAVDLINQHMLTAKLKHDDLAAAVRQRTLELDVEFQQRREKLLSELDRSKAERFTLLESEFHKLQESINLDTRRQVDEITTRSKQAKLQIVQDAQMKHNELQNKLTTTSIESVSTHVSAPLMDLNPTPSKSVNLESLNTVTARDERLASTAEVAELRTNTTTTTAQRI